MQPPDRFETERLVLRFPRMHDADALFTGYASDPEVTKFLTWQPHSSARETAAFIEKSIADADAGRAFSWVLTERQSERPIGMIVLSRDNPFCFHLGYVLERDSWNKGFVTEGARPIVEWVKDQPEIFRLYAVCDVENPASARVMEKLKLRYEGLLRRALVHVNASPEPRDVHCFAWTR